LFFLLGSLIPDTTGKVVVGFFLVLNNNGLQEAQS